MVDVDLIVLAGAVSRAFGWVYFLCWSLSFYPQPWLNYKRRSTEGLNIDFPTFNVIGFACYTVFTSSLLFSPSIRLQYAQRHPKSPVPTVQINDFAFAVHGFLLCAIVYSQFWIRSWGLKVGARQKASVTVLGIIWGGFLSTFAIIVLVWTKGDDGGNDGDGWAWLDVLYALSYIKVVGTIVKYMPQVIQNYRTKSTVGWSIWQIILDFVGGILSIAQLLIDCSLQADWSGITGNGVKFALGNVSILYDLIFFAQHYILYRHSPKGKPGTEEADEESPLLHGSR